MTASNSDDNALQSLRIRLSRIAQDKANLQGEYNLLSMILDTIDVLAVMLDNQGRIVRFNQTFEQYFRSPGEKLVQKYMWELPLYTPNGKLLSDRVKNIQDYLAAERRETFILAADGSPRVMIWSNKTFGGGEEQLEYVVSTGSDITERKGLEKLLEREQILLHSLIDSIPDAVFYKDTQGYFLGCNLAFETLSGHRAPEIVARRADQEFYPPDVAATFLESDQRVLTSQQTICYENRISKPGQPDTIIETRKSLYHGPDGEILGIIGISRDITQQKLAAEALRKANGEIEHLLASLPSILIVLSPDTRVIRWNPSAQTTFGIASHKAIGQPLGQLPISWKWEVIEAGLASCCSDNRPVFLQPIPFRRLDGREGLFGLGISPMREDNQALNGIILLGTDITERKALESQLAQAQKLESIGQLAAGIAHEINTPIQYVGDNTRFLQNNFERLLDLLEKYEQIASTACEGKLPPEMAALLEASRQRCDLEYLRHEIPSAIQESLEGIQRVAEIVRAMKEFSHPGVTQKTALDINKAIENTITVARNEWKYVADVEMHLSPQLPTVICQPGEINQALLNIIVNAAQAIQEMVQAKKYVKGKITIQTLWEQDGVEIRIHDTGPGIPDAVGQRIFDPFFTTKEVGKGTGQGLAIAYNVIVVKHGGILTYETGREHGTTFIIRLPLQPADKPLPGGSHA